MFTSSNDTVVTTFAGSDHFSVIHQWIDRCIARGIVAGLTVITAIDVAGTFTYRDSTVVTTNAGADGFIMIHQWIDRRPDSHVVTGLTLICTANVTRAFTGGCCTIVATDTRLTGYRVVVEAAQPGDNVVASVTRQTGWDMGWTFTAGKHAVMATFATTQRLVVINGRGIPADTGTGTMTGFAHIGSRQMAYRFTDNNSVVVTTGTHTHHFIVINGGVGDPGGGAVALLAVITGINMVRPLAGVGTVGIMTVDTNTQHLAMIGTGSGYPGIGGMASAA